jgi:hypothetical protein
VLAVPVEHGTQAIGEAAGEVAALQVIWSRLARGMEDSSDYGHPPFSLLREWRERKELITAGRRNKGEIKVFYGLTTRRSQREGGGLTDDAKNEVRVRSI